MTISSEEAGDRKETFLDWAITHWRWFVVPIVLLFALNNIAGLVVGIMGLSAVVNGFVGRVLKAKRVVQQVQQMVASTDEPPPAREARLP